MSPPPDMLHYTTQYWRKDLPLLPFHHNFRLEKKLFISNSTLNACLPPRTIKTVCAFRVAGFKYTAGVCSALADAVGVLYGRSISHLLVSRFLIDLNHQILQLPHRQPIQKWWQNMPLKFKTPIFTEIHLIKTIPNIFHSLCTNSTLKSPTGFSYFTEHGGETGRKERTPVASLTALHFLKAVRFDLKDKPQCQPIAPCLKTFMIDRPDGRWTGAHFSSLLYKPLVH